MANSVLTPTIITREALRVLHQKLNFLGNTNTQYDDRFANEGAKIGDTLQLRLPNKYTVRSGTTMSTQDTEEQKVDLTVGTRRGVDIDFSSTELTLDLDDFSQRILEPAMATLAANIEYLVLSNVYKDVYQQIDAIDRTLTFRDLGLAKKSLDDSLTPPGVMRACCLNTTDEVDLTDALKGLFHDSQAVKKQYREGKMGRTNMFDFYANTLMPMHTTGAGVDDGYLVNDAGGTIADGDSTIPIDTGSGAVNAGDVFTFASVNRVHPETKADTGELQKCVVTVDYSGGSGNLSISPALYSSGPLQNVTALPANNAALTFQYGTAGESHGISMGFHRDAFAFATADLVIPQGVDFVAREVYDGISMRIIRQYDINNDNFPCRIDVHFGWQTVRPEMAVRLAAN